MKNISKKGITLIELVVVIIILILLAVIAIWNTNRPLAQAEGANIATEFKAIYQSVSTLKDNFNAGYDLTQGVDYCALSSPDENGDVWYIVYGKQDIDKYDEKVVSDGLGLQDLQKSYEFRLNEDSFSSDVSVRYIDDRYVLYNGIKVRTYEDLQNVRGEITK